MDYMQIENMEIIVNGLLTFWKIIYIILRKKMNKAECGVSLS